LPQYFPRNRVSCIASFSHDKGTETRFLIPQLRNRVVYFFSFLADILTKTQFRKKRRFAPGRGKEEKRVEG